MISLEVEKMGVRDREVYIRVDEYKTYRVVIKDKETNRIIKEMEAVPIVKRVRRGRKIYEYYYIRILLPWASTISRVLRKRRDIYSLVVEVV